MADTEDWEPKATRSHSRRPRRGRRAKAKARREEWNHARHQAYCETKECDNGNSSLFGALLTAIAEVDPLERDFGSESDSFASSGDHGSGQSDSI